MSLKLVTQAKQNNNKNYFDESKNENNFVLCVLLYHLYRASSLICLQKDLLLHKLNSPNTRLRTQLAGMVRVLHVDELFDRPNFADLGDKYANE